MALHIRNEEADRLARELSARTGESLTQAVVTALRERLARQPAPPAASDVAAELLAIGQRNVGHPLLDNRSSEEILGYDTAGVPR
jgi:antitoxin VapB